MVIRDIDGLDLGALTPASVQSDMAVQTSAAAGDAQSAPGEYALTDDQRRSLQYSAFALKRWGWASFWIQLALSLTSTGILLFSVAFTASVRA